jgi:hypothetical protein
MGNNPFLAVYFRFAQLGSDRNSHKPTWEFCGKHRATTLADSEQNEQMKKHPFVRVITNKLLKMLVFKKQRGVEHRVIRNQ